jgi:hypothetical protein
MKLPASRTEAGVLEAESPREQASTVDFSALDWTFVDKAGDAADGPAQTSMVVPSAAEGSPASSPLWTRYLPSKAASGMVILMIILAGQAFTIGVLAVALRRAKAIPDTGSVTIATTPPGATVQVDAVERGVSPVTMSLGAGVHRVAITTSGGARREFPVDVRAGTTLSHAIELALPAAAVGTGALEIRSRPPGALVVVAGQARGRTPVTVRDLRPGIHEVLLTHGTQQIRESVTLAAHATAQLTATFPIDGAAPRSGWIAVSSPIELTLVDSGRVIGTSQSDRIMVPAGRRLVEFVNERLGFRVSRQVDVSPGQVAALAIDVPTGTVNVNALPWAEVWMDERKLGDTPLAALSLPIGSHQFIFRHPSLGERREEVTVIVGAPVRVSVDMRR